MTYSQEFYAMGTQMEITIFNCNFTEVQIQQVLWYCVILIEKLEQEFSRFREDSFLTRLNNTKQWEISEDFLNIFTASKYFHKLSSGYFNPLVNVASLWYEQSFESIKKNRNNVSPTWEVNLDLENIKITGKRVELQENQNLDFWWIVKWYTVDKVKEFLQDAWYKNFCINAGWDIWMSGKISAAEKMTVWVENPFLSDEYCAMLEIENLWFSTSGTYRRKWKIWDSSFHHIINPYSWKSPDELVSVSIISDNCMSSDVLATIWIAMWKQIAQVFYQTQGIPALLIDYWGNIFQTAACESYNIEILPFSRPLWNI